MFPFSFDLCYKLYKFKDKLLGTIKNEHHFSILSSFFKIQQQQQQHKKKTPSLLRK